MNTKSAYKLSSPSKKVHLSRIRYLHNVVLEILVMVLYLSSGKKGISWRGRISARCAS